MMYQGLGAIPARVDPAGSSAAISYVLLPQGVVMTVTLRLDASKIVEPIRQSVIMLTAIGGSMALAVAISQGVAYAFALVNAVLLP